MQEYDELFNDEEMTKANTITFHANNKVLFEKVGNAGMYRIGEDEHYSYLELVINERVNVGQSEICRHSSIDVMVKAQTLDITLSGCRWIEHSVPSRKNESHILWSSLKPNSQEFVLHDGVRNYE